MGACEDCNGLGYKTLFDPDLIITDKTLSINQGALEHWLGKITDNNQQYATIGGFAAHYKFDLNMPYYRLSNDVKRLLFYGSDEEVQLKIKTRTKSYRTIQKLLE